MAMPQKVNGRKLFNAVPTSRKLLVDGLLLLRFHDAVAVVCEQHTLQPVTPTVVNARALRAVSQARVCGKNVFCIVLSKKFNIMSAFFLTNRSLGRKKSILARVCFDAK